MSDAVPYEHLFAALKNDAAVAQSYEAMLSSLHLLHPTRPLQSLLMTSTQPREGKTEIKQTAPFAPIHLRDRLRVA